MKFRMSICIGYIILSFFTINIYAQDSLSTKNSAYLELGGNCLFLSLNYEREIIYNISARVGVGICPALPQINSKTNETKLIIIPIYTVMIGYFLRTSQYSSHGLILSFGLSGATQYIIDSRYNKVYTGKMGYRYSPFEGGTMFEITYTPVWLKDKSFSWFGIGIGASI